MLSIYLYFEANKLKCYVEGTYNITGKMERT